MPFLLSLRAPDIFHFSQFLIDFDLIWVRRAPLPLISHACGLKYPSYHYSKPLSHAKTIFSHGCLTAHGL